MGPIYDPAQLTHPRLREFAVVVAGIRRVIATLAESANDLEDLLIDVPPAEDVLPKFSTPWPWEADTFVVALRVVQLNQEVTGRGLEEKAATWLGRIPTTGPCFV